MISSEFSIFLAFVLIGIIISFLFDFFRILRRVYKTPDFITILEDIIFWIVSGIILLIGIFVFNEGKIRAYLFLGISMGIIFYIVTLSKFITKFGIAFLNFLNKCMFGPIQKIIKILCNILYKIIKCFKRIIGGIKFDNIFKQKMKKQKDL